jgi:hypothetical protein
MSVTSIALICENAPFCFGDDAPTWESRVWLPLALHGRVAAFVVGRAPPPADRARLVASGGRAYPPVRGDADAARLGRIAAKVRSLGAKVVVFSSESLFATFAQADLGDAARVLALETVPEPRPEAPADRLWLADGAAGPGDVAVPSRDDARKGEIRAALAALGLEPDESFAALSHNFEFEIKDWHSFFNPVSRLLSAQCFVRSLAPPQLLSGFWESETHPDLPNAWVQTTISAHGWIFVSFDAILPADADPGELTLVLEICGRPAFRRPLSSDLPQEAAGLISVERDGDRIEIEGWRLDPDARIKAGKGAPSGSAIGETAMFGTRPVELVRAEAKWPLGRESVTMVAARGIAKSHGAIGSWIGSELDLTSPRLEAMRDAYRGQIAWLVGNGPSVRVEDLERLKDRVTFGFNRYYMSHDLSELRPTFTVTGDRQMIEDFGQEIVDRSGGTVFVAHDTLPFLVGDYIWVRQLNYSPPLFSKHPATAVTPGGSSVFVAMQIAYWLGIRRFFFYGADFRFSFTRQVDQTDAYRAVAGDDNHFIKNYRDGKAWCPPSFRNIASAFLAARVLIESEGGFIKNVTRGGLLEIFPRMSFEEALELEP